MSPPGGIMLPARHRVAAPRRGAQAPVAHPLASAAHLRARLHVTAAFVRGPRCCRFASSPMRAFGGPIMPGMGGFDTAMPPFA